MNESHVEVTYPNAEACLEHGVTFATEGCGLEPAGQAGAFLGFMYGLGLGLAWGQIDAQSAKQTYDEIVNGLVDHFRPNQPLPRRWVTLEEVTQIMLRADELRHTPR